MFNISSKSLKFTLKTIGKRGIHVSKSINAARKFLLIP